MRIRRLRNGIRSNVAKLPDTMLIVKSFLTFTHQHDTQCSKRFASVRLTCYDDSSP